MARPSPGAQRIVAMLNFFADNPGRAYSMTDLIKALKFNRSTLHSLLGELVEANYLFRTKDKQYLLGSAVARLGNVAATHLSPLQAALPEMRALADAYDLVCSAMFRDKNEVVVKERAAAAAKLEWYPSPSFRWPMRLPVGALFLSASAEAEIEMWMDAMRPPPSLEQRARVHAGMRFLQEHGYSFIVREDAMRAVAAEQFLPGDPAESRLAAGITLDIKAEYQIASIAAPVRDAQGRIAFVLGLSAFDRPYSAKEIAEIGGKLRVACENISGFYKGL